MFAHHILSLHLCLFMSPPAPPPPHPITTCLVLLQPITCMLSNSTSLSFQHCKYFWTPLHLPWSYPNIKLHSSSPPSASTGAGRRLLHMGSPSFITLFPIVIYFRPGSFIFLQILLWGWRRPSTTNPHRMFSTRWIQNRFSLRIRTIRNRKLAWQTVVIYVLLLLFLSTIISSHHPVKVSGITRPVSGRQQ